MADLTTIELFKENMKFSAGHFTIFNATERERVHGHNFTVQASIIAVLLDNGMTFDYAVYKEHIRKICRSLNEYVILPEFSPYMRLEEEGDYIYGHFNGEKIPFLTSGVRGLPIRNSTVEELSRWLLGVLLDDEQSISDNQIKAVTVKVFSAPGQGASAQWSAK